MNVFGNLIIKNKFSPYMISKCEIDDFYLEDY